MEPLTPDHIAVLERLLLKGFHPAVFPLYPNSVGIRRGAFAALLEPAGGGAFRQMGQAFYVIEGNLSVRVMRGGREWFVWKSKQIEATLELLGELAEFSSEVSAALAPAV